MKLRPAWRAATRAWDAIRAWARPRRRILLIGAACALAAMFVGWLYLFLRPDTWRYYTDELSFRHLGRDAKPRLVLWEDALPVEGRFNVPGDWAEPAVSPDGRLLVFTRGAGQGNANLFMVRWDGRSWGEPRGLRALNSPFNEISPAFSPDGTDLYFCTDRPGGMGGYDIWVSRWDGAEFAWPLPLSLMVNSRFDDLGPAAWGGRLYFSSSRPREPLTKEEEALSGRELRERFRGVDHDLHEAELVPEGTTAKEEVERALSMLYSLRAGALTDPAVMKKLGGTPETEAAVNRALEWLAAQQETNGCWSIVRGGGEPGHDVAATSFALLTFFGRGVRHDRPGRYQDTVARGVRWLVAQQNHLTGDMRGEKPLSNGMYDHAIASLAMGEAYGLTKDEELYTPAQSAVDFLADAQNEQDGGWRYQPKEAGDMSVSGWAIMALKNAELSGLHIQKRTYEGVKKWLKVSEQGQHGGIFDYQPKYQGGGWPAMRATGYFCSQLMGLSPNTEKAMEATAYVRQTALTGNAYYAYYGTLCSYQNQGPAWRAWREDLYKLFLANQEPAGSWKLTEAHGEKMGRVICTALIALSLQAHYRYTPLYGLGYEPRETGGKLSLLNEADLPRPPAFRRAKRMAELCSSKNDMDPAVAWHGDFLYFASNRRGGAGGMDLYRSRISGERPQAPANLGPGVNTPADERGPALRMAGFQLVFMRDGAKGDGEESRVYSSTSRVVYRRHMYERMPAIGWMLRECRWRMMGIGLTFLALIGCAVQLGRNGSGKSAA